jgi:acylphosphatase
MNERRAYRISGVVQGVGFRWWARQEASRLGLHGRVRNQPDATVHLEASGEPAALDRLERLLAQGPPGSRVSHVTRLEPGTTPLPARFEIAP